MLPVSDFPPWLKLQHLLIILSPTVSNSQHLVRTVSSSLVIRSPALVISSPQLVGSSSWTIFISARLISISAWLVMCSTMFVMCNFRLEIIIPEPVPPDGVFTLSGWQDGRGDGRSCALSRVAGAWILTCFQPAGKLLGHGAGAEESFWRWVGDAGGIGLLVFGRREPGDITL